MSPADSLSPVEGPRFSQLSHENREWLESFWKAHGRRPRILHIGNIANNAYNNAKLLNSAGLECDVLCYDYYHAMGCPEWEDADFDGEITDMFRPDWTEVNLNGFERPRWFAQGPLDLCVEYLIARHEGDSAHAWRLWEGLARFNKSRLLLGDTRLHQAKSPLIEYIDKRWRLISVMARSRVLLRSNVETRLNHLREVEGVSERIRSVAGLGYFLIAVLAACVLLWPRHALGISDRSRKDIDRYLAELATTFHSSFPCRTDQISQSDFVPYLYRWMITMWDKLYRHYDIVQAYSTDTILPVLSQRDYFGFEHGTLRDIPFSNTPTGRLTALSYHLARHVFVTNFDCLDNARALSGDRVTMINHPYDEDHGLCVSGWETLRAELQRELEAEFLFFFPTRHDWVEGTGYSDKANDVFLRAFTELRRRNHKVGVICCNWGSNVSQSQQLLDDQGCARHVKWVAPVGMVKFERMARACDLVVDQFKLGAFGGVMFKAMAVGSPVCTFLDTVRIRAQYPELPPVVNCRSEQELLQALPALIASPQRVAEIGAACHAWIKRYHACDDTIDAQMEQYRRFCCA